MAIDTTISSGWETDLQISYLRAGDSGPPVVLVHGWGAFKELWWSTLLALAPNYRAFAPDLPAHGHSPFQHNTFTMSELADLVVDFCMRHDLEQISLVGHSMGGNIALELALRHPELVRRLVLVDAAIDVHLMPGYARLHADRVYGWAVLRIRMAFNNVLRPLSMRVPHRHGGGLVRPWLRRSWYMLQHNPEGLHRILNGLFVNPLVDRASQVQVPTLVMTGQFDSLVPFETSRRLAQIIPGARFAVIPGAVHNPMDERPNAFERVLLQFLQEL